MTEARATRIAGACVVLADRIELGGLVCRDGLIEAVGQDVATGDAIDWQQDLLLPGLIDCHTDNLERHLVPRPGVRWPNPVQAVLAHDLEMAGAGITTVLNGVSLGAYRERPERHGLAALAVDGIAQARDSAMLRADHYLHFRCEISDSGMGPLLHQYAHRPELRLMSVTDHTPGLRQWRDLAHYRRHRRLDALTDAEFEARVRAAQAQRDRVAPDNRALVLAMAREHAVRLATHDDTLEPDIDEAIEGGATISEFPTTLAAALRAHRLGMCVVAGAPNVIRGESHSGNVSAFELHAHGVLDVLASDYVPHSLLDAVFHLAGGDRSRLPAAVQLAAGRPATMLGLNDRGRLQPGLRADFLRVALFNGVPVVREVWRGGRRVA